MFVHILHHSITHEDYLGYNYLRSTSTVKIKDNWYDRCLIKEKSCCFLNSVKFNIFKTREHCSILVFKVLFEKKMCLISPNVLARLS